MLVQQKEGQIGLAQVIGERVREKLKEAQGGSQVVAAPVEEDCPKPVVEPVVDIEEEEEKEEMNEQDFEEYSEDEIEIQGYYYQIDIWSVEDYTELVTRTKELLEANDFKFIDQEDLYEKDTKIFHKGLRYYIPNYR